MNTAFLHIEHQLIDAGFTPKQVEVQLKIIAELANNTFASKVDIKQLENKINNVEERLSHKIDILEQKIDNLSYSMKNWFLMTGISTIGIVAAIMSIIHYLK